MIPNRIELLLEMGGSQGGACFREKNQELCFGHVEMSINPSGDFVEGSG